MKVEQVNPFITQGWKNTRLIYLGYALLIYGCLNLFSGIHSGDFDAILEGLGRNYLLVVMTFAVLYVYETGQKGLDRALQAWFWGAIAMALITYLGYLFTFLGFPNRAVASIANYPYWGTVYRAAGWTGGSGMLVLVFIVPTLYAWRKWRDRAWHWSTWATLLFILFLTLSKEVVLVLLGMAMLDPYWRQLPKIFKAPLIASFALVFWFGTHFLVLPQQDINETYLNNTQFTNEKVLGSIGEYQVVETSYTALKRAGWLIGIKYPWFGVGPGQFSKQLPAEKELGNYPKHIPSYDPHSTWMGAFSETGLLGLGSLLLILFLLFPILYALWKRYPQNAAVQCLTVYLWVLLLASVSVDAMNFRHLWIPVGLLLGFQIHEQGQTATIAA